MVDVTAPHRHVMERANIVADSERERADHQHRGKETDRGQEQPFARRLQELALINAPKPCMANDGAESAENGGNQDRKDPKTPVRPEHRYFDLGTPVTEPR